VPLVIQCQHPISHAQRHSHISMSWREIVSRRLMCQRVTSICQPPGGQGRNSLASRRREIQNRKRCLYNREHTEAAPGAASIHSQDLLWRIAPVLSTTHRSVAPRRRQGIPLTQHQLLSIESVWPPQAWRDATVVVGVSGGPDSTALLCRLAELRRPGDPGRLVAAYFDHGWRGDEGRAEADFVKQLAERLGQSFVAGRSASPSEQAGGLGREGTARRERYAFFEQVARHQGARYLALAHTRDDQVETILHRLLRGAGLHGLCGMSPVRPWIAGCAIVRPFLEIPRCEILEYLEHRRQPFLEDATNRDRTLTRNRLRAELLPLLRRDYNRQIDEALLRIGRRARDYMELLRDLIEPLVESSRATTRADLIEFDVRPLHETPRAVRTEFLRYLWRAAEWPLRKMTARHWEEMTDALDQPGAVRSFPGDAVLRHEEHRIRMTRQPSRRDHTDHSQ